MRSRRIVASLALAGLAVLVLGACGGGDAPAEQAATASGEATAVEGAGVLMDAQSLTALDQPIAYPKKGQAQISSEIEVLEPGQESGWRKYRVPAYVHVLEGTLSVEYDAGVVKEFPAGTSFLQAKGVWHNVSNKADARAQFLTVMMGAKGIAGMAER
jgi:quercetin dioxygenase-like cupin family protein